VDKILKPITWIEDAIAGLALGAVSLIIFSQVISRYFFEYTPIWSEELSRFLVVWSIFIGVSIGVRENKHIGVDALIRFLPPKLKVAFECLLNVIGIAVIGVLIYTSIQFIQHTMEFEQLSPAMRIPMYIPYLAMPVGLSLSLIHFIMNIIRLFTAHEEPTEMLF
jgi:C4-dicarboxylate transporter DctQ subunit